MAKRSEIQSKIEQLQAELENADTDDEIWLKDASGTEVKVSGKRATAVLDRFKELWATEDEGEGDGEGDGRTGDDGSSDQTDAPTGGYFGRRSKGK